MPQSKIQVALSSYDRISDAFQERRGYILPTKEIKKFYWVSTHSADDTKAYTVLTRKCYTSKNKEKQRAIFFLCY